jgi:photosystem II cytochrome c550
MWCLSRRWISKTNPNVGLDPEALSLATPSRDNIDV